MGFDPRTVQPLASRYIDYATRPTVMRETSKIITSPEFEINLGIEIFKLKKLAASSMLHEAKIAYYAFDVIVYCMYTHQTRIAYTKRTH